MSEAIQSHHYQQARVKSQAFFTQNKWFIYVNGSYKGHFFSASHSLSPEKLTAVVRMQCAISQQKCNSWWLLALRNAAPAPHTHALSILTSSALSTLASWSSVFKHNSQAWRGMKSGTVCDVVCMWLARMHPPVGLWYQTVSCFISWEAYVWGWKQWFCALFSTLNWHVLMLRGEMHCKKVFFILLSKTTPLYLQSTV